MSEKLNPHTKLISRRNFLIFSALAGLGIAAGWRPEKTHAAEVIDLHPLTLGELYLTSGKAEPARIHFVMTSLELSQSGYQLTEITELSDQKKVFGIREDQLMSELQNLVVTGSNQLFTDLKSHTSPFYASQAANLDTRLNGKPLHMGIDFLTQDPHKINTIFLNPIRAKYLGPINIGRMSVGTPIVQAVDSAGENIQVTLGGISCELIMMYAHLLPVQEFQPGKIIEVGSPLGDITKDLKNGGSTGPHTHVETVAIPRQVMERVRHFELSIQRVLLNEEYNPKAENVYLDTNVIWKLLPGTIATNTGVTKEVWAACKDLETLEKHHGK